MMIGRAYVLLSGGIDSSTCLHLAYRQFDENVVGVSVNYGQRHSKEIEYAARSCKSLNVRHHLLDLSSIMPQTMLTDVKAEIPNISYSEIKGVSPTYVPFRNGTLLSAVTSFVIGELEMFKKDAAAWPGEPGEPEWGIFFGAHAEDAQNWAYPDCTPEFIGAMANAIFIGTYKQVRLHTPLEWLSKHEIIKLGVSLGVNWENTWSCYVGSDKHCGVCPTCRARRDGFAAAGVVDPTEYAE